MSLATWHPPPVTHIGFSGHTSNGEYGKWPSLPSNGHYAPVSSATTTLPPSPWLNRKLSTNGSRNNSFAAHPEATSAGATVSFPSYTHTNGRVEDSDRHLPDTHWNEVRKNHFQDSNNNIALENGTRTSSYNFSEPSRGLFIFFLRKSISDWRFAKEKTKNFAVSHVSLVSPRINWSQQQVFCTVLRQFASNLHVQLHNHSDAGFSAQKSEWKPGRCSRPDNR